MVTRTDFSDDPRYKRAQSCKIHDEVRFAIDDECPKCLDLEDNDNVIPYITYIEYLELRVGRLEVKLYDKSRN